MTHSQPGDRTIDAQEQPVPYALTPLAEALLGELPDAGAEDPEPEIG